jgi:UDP-N-acetylmuramate dehydrogenase
LVIVNRTHTVAVDPGTGTLTADSGTPTNLVVQTANRAGLAGLAPFMGVPGSIGGAVYNNAHFNTHQIGDIVSSVSVLTADNDIRSLTNGVLDFSYDHSVFQQQPHLILSVSFHLLSGDPTALEKISKDSVMHRKTTQPLEFASSGCIFKNLSTPGYKGMTSAGAIIDGCGLKDLAVGDAKVSDKHANFIVNTGHASASDVIELIRSVTSSVKLQTGQELTPEVFIINETGERLFL